jgi:hypothetical protein
MQPLVAYVSRLTADSQKRNHWLRIFRGYPASYPNPAAISSAYRSQLASSASARGALAAGQAQDDADPECARWHQGDQCG